MTPPSYKARLEFKVIQTVNMNKNIPCFVIANLTLPFKQKSNVSGLNVNER